MNLLFWFIILIIFSVVTSAYSLRHGSSLKHQFEGKKTIYDTVHENLPDLTKYYKFYDALLLVFILPLVFTTQKYDILKFTKQLCSVLFCVLALYCIMTSLTITGPTTNHDRDFGSPLWQAFFGHESLLLISGHCCFVLTLILTMKQFGIISSSALWLFLAASFALFATMSRNHYTIDPIVSFFVVWTVFDIVNGESAALSVLFPKVKNYRKY